MSSTINTDILKQRVQRWIVFISVFILCCKFAAFYFTNSVGILTDAMESIVNVTAGLITLYSLKLAAKPKDGQHPFGHGKIELISASVEGILIAVAGGLMIYEGISRLFSDAVVQKLDIGIALVAICGVLNYIMGWYSIKMGKKHLSIALIAGGKHLQSDTYSTIGLVLGLVLLYFTGLSWIDALLAMIFGGIIVFTGFSILKKTINNLIDGADEEVLNKITEIVSENRRPDWIDIHNTKIIKYGSRIFIDCDLTLPWFYNVNDSHDACDSLKDCFAKEFEGRAQVSIHSDPCKEAFCKNCMVDRCEYRKDTFLSLNKLTLYEITKIEEE